MLYIKEKLHEDITILSLYGDLDYKSAHQLKIKLDSLVKLGRQKIIINMKHINVLDSSGVNSLVYGQKLINPFMGDLKLACLSPRNTNVIVALELDKIFSIFSSEEGALRSFLSEIPTIH